MYLFYICGICSLFTTTSTGTDEIIDHMKLLNLLSVGLACFCLVANVFWIKDMAASGRSAASLCSSLLSYVQRKGELILKTLQMLEMGYYLPF